MSSPNGASSWDTNPVVASWKREVADKGGRALAGGYPFPPDKGAPCASYLLNPSLGWAASGNRRYELAPFSVQRAVDYEQLEDKAVLGAGKVAESAEDLIKATGLDQGIFGVIGKVLGIPAGVAVAIAVIAGGVIGYAALVNVGLLPPLKQMTGR